MKIIILYKYLHQSALYLLFAFKFGTISSCGATLHPGDMPRHAETSLNVQCKII